MKSYTYYFIYTVFFLASFTPANGHGHFLSTEAVNAPLVLADLLIDDDSTDLDPLGIRVSPRATRPQDNTQDVLWNLHAHLLPTPPIRYTEEDLTNAMHHAGNMFLNHLEWMRNNNTIYVRHLIHIYQINIANLDHIFDVIIPNLHNPADASREHLQLFQTLRYALKLMLLDTVAKLNQTPAPLGPFLHAARTAFNNSEEDPCPLLSMLLNLRTMIGVSIHPASTPRRIVEAPF